MTQANIGLPGVASKRTATRRRVLLTELGSLYYPGTPIIVGSDSRDPTNTGDLDVLQAGMLMGLNSTSGKWAPSIIGTLNTAHTSNSATSMTLTAATAVELNRRIGASGTFKITGPPSSAGSLISDTITYSAMNVSPGVATMSAESSDFIAGSFIQDTDGTENPKVIIGDGYGIKTTDIDDASADVPFAHTGGEKAMLIGGIIDSSQIINWPTDTSLQKWIVEQLNGLGPTVSVDGSNVVTLTQGRYIFDHLWIV